MCSGSLGFAVVILIGLFVRDELSYNSFLPGYQDVYWVTADDCRARASGR